MGYRFELYDEEEKIQFPDSKERALELASNARDKGQRCAVFDSRGVQIAGCGKLGRENGKTAKRKGKVQ